MYPIALHLQGKKCIVFGAGKVAQRRVWGLLESGAEVTVAAPEPMPACWKNAKLTYLQQLCTGTAGGKPAGVCATDDSAENAASREAQAAESWHRR
ncbi:MAG: NAD(P)-dependent oxidoreductase [Ruminococcus callidus]